MTFPEAIRVIGARLHNLKHIDVEIPLHRLTVVTGVSGSGKSSLAFDTIYAEGQRRYVESLSAYARQFLERMEKPEVDAIEGIAPAIAIRQKNGTRTPRSTVGTATEIYDYLRVLFARVGETRCPDCQLPVERISVDTAAAALLATAAARRAYALFPITASGAELAPRLAELRARGFNRLYQAGQVVEFSTPESLLDLDFSHSLFVLVDRLVIESGSRGRIVDAIETGYREAGEAVFHFPAGEAGHAPAPIRFNERLECKQCGRRFEDPEPRLFSFNTPYGACPRCQGFGCTSDFDLALVVPNQHLTLSDGAVDPWTKPKTRRWQAAMVRHAAAAGVPLDVPWKALAPEHQEWVLQGDGKFSGVQGFFALLERKKYRLRVRVFLARYRGYTRCPDCKGSRLRPQAQWVGLRGGGAWRNLGAVTAMTIAGAHAFFTALELSPTQLTIAAAVLLEIQRRLEFLLKVGLQYLTLDRLAGTLSGGEAQRIQLATCLGSQLVGSLYVLDEPSIGLHPRDTARLIAILGELRDLGNTILVVEHDQDVIRAADWLLELGPAAGEGGGELVAQGTPAEVSANPKSLTGRYLSGASTVPSSRRRTTCSGHLRIKGAFAHNLRNIDVEFPLNCLVAVTGVSGSGKSTLVHEVLHKSLQALLQGRARQHEGEADWIPVGCGGLRGAESIKTVEMVDQSPIGRTPRSNPVTYIKAFDGIRQIFASQPEARKLGLKPGAFSFNVPGGRCEACQGEGVVTVDMQFLADVSLVCEECGGTRYQSRVLEVRYREHNIHQILQLTVREAMALFADSPGLLKPLAILDEIGLGYLRLGQSATTLSGGEAQRMKLALHLSQPRAAAGTLFLLDEPTTGLHADDIVKLLTAFQRLLQAGASILVIEHNLDVIRTADWMVDLGPEGGEGGGLVVAAGTPEQVTGMMGSYTGAALARALTPA